MEFSEYISTVVTLLTVAGVGGALGWLIKVQSQIDKVKEDLTENCSKHRNGLYDFVRNGYVPRDSWLQDMKHRDQTLSDIKKELDELRVLITEGLSAMSKSITDLNIVVTKISSQLEQHMKINNRGV